LAISWGLICQWRFSRASCIVTLFSLSSCVATLYITTLLQRRLPRLSIAFWVLAMAVKWLFLWLSVACNTVDHFHLVRLSLNRRLRTYSSASISRLMFCFCLARTCFQVICFVLFTPVLSLRDRSRGLLHLCDTCYTLLYFSCGPS